MLKEIYIIRHGETDYNSRGIVQGKGIDSNINVEGILQAQKFFDYYNHVHFQKIYISTLLRTYQSISPFLIKNIPIEKHQGLNEISWGIHEGKSNGDTFKVFYSVLHQWKQGQTDHKIDGGESPNELQERQLDFIKTIEHAEDETILICSHGRAIRILLCTLLNLPLSEMDHFPHSNLSLYKLNYLAGSFTIEQFNNTDHLHEK